MLWVRMVALLGGDDGGWSGCEVDRSRETWRLGGDDGGRSGCEVDRSRETWRSDREEEERTQPELGRTWRCAADGRRSKVLT